MADKTLLELVVDTVGVTVAAGLASFFGAVAGMAFMKGITPKQAVVAIFAGLGVGSYGSAAIVANFQLSPGTAGLLAFLGGALAMPLLGFLFAAADRLKMKAQSVVDRGLARALGPEPLPPPPPAPGAPSVLPPASPPADPPPQP